MSPFWILAALFVVATLATLLWPLLRAERDAGANPPDVDTAAVTVYRDQKRSLDAELASGTITAVEHEAAVAELAGRVADEVRDMPPAQSPAAPPAPMKTAQSTAARAAPGPVAAAPAVTSATPAPRALAAAGALLIIVPLAAFLLYRYLGDPGAAIVAASDPTQELGEPQVNAMIESLKHRLQQHPNEAESWAMLARSYVALERFSDAVGAFVHADVLSPNNPDILADYADALAMTQGKKFSGKPAALVAQALALDPKNKRALAMAATIALQAHDVAGSLALWRRLAAELPPGSEDLQEINDVIAQLEASRGRGGPLASTSQPQSAGGPFAPAPAAAGPFASTTNPGAPAASGGPPGPSITGRVALGTQFAAKAAPSDTVFIFARATEGPRMPLAILRIAAKDLPKDFLLDDSLGMAGVKLSSAASVVVEARLSKSGNAMPQAGDLFGRSAPIKPGARGVNIVIDQVVP